jgi:AcrR family transcriptional regulator
MRARTDLVGPRSFTEQARRTQIVAAAIEVIAELGFGQASYARIAERAGLSSTGLISYHFTSKAELIDAALIEIGQSASSRIASRTEAQPTAVGKLRARIEAELEWVSAYPSYVRALYEISMNARDDEGSLRYGPELTADANVYDLEPLLRAGQESGELREFDRVLAALAIKSTIDAAIYRLSVDPTLSLSSCVDQIAGFFERALRADA